MNEITATDDILVMFKTAWDAGADDLLGYVPDVEWPGIIQATPHDKTKPWARITVSHNDGGQTGLGGSAGKMYTRTGLIMVQVFTPRDLLMGQQLAIIARNAFEGLQSANGVWFRNGRVNEVGPSAAWYQTNCITDFQYDEIK